MNIIKSNKKLLLLVPIVIVIIGVVFMVNSCMNTVIIDSSSVKDVESLHDVAVDKVDTEGSVPHTVVIDGNPVALGVTTTGNIQDFGWNVSTGFVDTEHYSVKFDYKNGVVVGYNLKKKADVDWSDVPQDLSGASYLGQVLNEDDKDYLSVWSQGTERQGDFYVVNLKHEMLKFKVDNDTRIVEVVGVLK